MSAPTDLKGFEQLTEQLQLIHDSQSPNERRAASEALVAVLQFLKAAGIDARLCAPIVRLIAALHDLDRGVRPPILEVTKGKKGRSSARMALMGTVSAAIEFLLQAGMTLDEACLICAKELTNRGIKIAAPQRKTPTDSLKEWRNQIRKTAKPSHSLWYGRVIYDRHLREVKALLEKNKNDAGISDIPPEWYGVAAKTALEDLIDDVNR